MLRRLALGLVLLAGCAASPTLPPLLVQGDGLRATDEQGLTVELLAGEGSAVASQPSWSPDATFAVWTEVDPTANTARIAMGNGESQRRIDGSTIPFFYGFSPDGKTLAYLGTDPRGGGVALGLVDVASGSAQLLDSGQPYYFDWAPDSSRLVVHANQTDTYLISVVGEIQPLDVAPGVYQAPAFLEDGRLLLVENGSLTAVEPQSGEREVLVVVDAFSQFTVSGERIAYTSSDQLSPGPLSVLVLGEPGKAEITDRQVVAFEWSPDGRLLYYLGLSRDGLVPAVWDGSMSVDFPAAFPSSVFLQNYLPFWDQYSRFHTMWKADSSGFYFPRDGAEIAFYPAGGGEAMVVAEGSVAFPAPR